MQITIVSDAWFPQVNGVVRTLSTVGEKLTEMGHAITFITPQDFRTIPCPTYPEIRLALMPDRKMAKLIEAAQPSAIHIATEGPLGHAARGYCIRRGLPFTTAYHTKFPEYVRARTLIPIAWSYAVMRRFHGRSQGVMVATDSLRRELEHWGIRNAKPWTRGVDIELFHPRPSVLNLPRPISMYVGRVAVEKNISAFLELDVPGTKVVVGDGPQRDELARKHPEAVFVGAKSGVDLAEHYASADVFVFPSRTDTFGLVLIEAMACGVPVAAFPVPGPLDVVGESGAGVLDEDLAKAVQSALKIDRAIPRVHALDFTWEKCAEIFLENLAPFGSDHHKSASQTAA